MTKDQTRSDGQADTRSPVVVVTGPTASGKSGLALALARAFDGVVVNGDAMQVYRELAVLTARPSAEDMALAPHRLYGVLPGAAACSAGRWRGLALAEIAAAQEVGRLPFVVGGTGLYLRALVRGLTELPPIPAPLRAAARERHRARGGPAMHAELAARDPVTAARLRPG
ncbi:MAG: tRNA (adenosine(37)-N6)-dimethylallyltransferase MiaA, partial [Rhodospirillales bacterium]|nr:tRNA (adenosine(37)-N6)-dimethylallyltransferase MiaA [Rhodospirillales bacterium]